MKFIDLIPQQKKIKTTLNNNINSVLKNGNYIYGKEVFDLENKLANYTKTKHAIACGSGTDALVLTLKSLELEPDTEIITPAFSFFASASTIILANLKPVFVDIDSHTYNIDTNKILSAITKKTKAIIAVSLFGRPANFDKINKIAKDHNLLVIEDGAQSFGANYKAKKSCSLTDFATTSFFPTKPLGCYGDGGMIFCKEAIFEAKLRQLSNHGQSSRYHHEEIGINSRLDTIQAAILLSKIEILDEEINQRRQIGLRYNQALSDIVKTPKLTDEYDHIFSQYVIEVDNREEFMSNMKKQGVPTMIHYPTSIPKQPAFRSYLADFEVADKVASRVVALPIYPYLPKYEQDKVIRAVKKSL